MSKRSKIALGTLMLCFAFCLFMGLSGQKTLNKMLGFASGDELVAVKPTSVSVSGASTVNVGSKITFTATGSPSTASMSGVIWSQSGYGAVTISPTGISGNRATASITGKTVGTVQVCASVSGVKNCKTITVHSASSGSSSSTKLSSITVSGSDRLPVGSSVTFRATPYPSSASLSRVTWTMQSAGGTGSVRISGSGTSATVTGVATGSVKVCATSGNVVGCKTLTVYNNVITSLTNGCSSPSKVAVGGQINLANCGKYTPYDRSVNFSCSVVSGSSYVTISKDSTGCIVLGRSAGTATVRLRETNSNKTVDIKVQVTGGSGGSSGGTTTELDTITCPKLSITIGQTKVFGASSSLYKNLTYSTSAPNLSLSGNKITASGYLSSSSVQYVNVVSTTGVRKSCPVTVNPASSSGTTTPSPTPDPTPTPNPTPNPTPTEVNSKITLSKYSTTLIVGATESLGYSATPSGMGIRWKTTNPEVATVTNGVIHAVGVGTANIIAYSATNDAVYAICYVTVVSNRVEVTGIQISPTTLNVIEGKTGYFNYALIPTSATDQGVYFKSADPTIATVNSAGLVTGVKEGRTTVTVYTKDGKKSSTGTVIVYPKESKIETKPITPPSTGGNTTNNNNTNNTTNNITHTTTVIIPTGSDYKSYDNTLISLKVDGKNIYLGSYMPTVFVDNSVTEVKVEYIKSDPKAKVVVAGNKNLQVGNNIVTVTVTAEIGDVNVYRVVVVRRGKENNITSNVLTENKEIKIITTVAPVVDMDTIEDVKDNNKTLIVLIQDNSGRTLYEWNVDGSYLTYVEGGLDTYITYLVNVPHPLNETITDKEASYLGFRQRGVLPSVAIINVYVGEKYEDGTILNLYRYNDATSGVEYQYGNIKVSGGYIQLRIYDGAEYILTPNLIQVTSDMWIIYLGILLFIILICATIYMIYRDHRREKW